MEESTQIREDEGVETNLLGNQISYVDSVGVLTAGVGHRLTDEEASKYPEGTEVPDEVVDEWLATDLEEAKVDVTSLTSKLSLPEEATAILTNMAFNLGRTRLSKFKKMFKALSDMDYGLAADEMMDSKWFNQTGDRAKRLVERMRNIT